MKFRFLLYALIFSVVSCGNQNGSGVKAAGVDSIAASTVEVADKTKAHFVVISKEKMTLSLFDYQSNKVLEIPIACGKGIGNKRKSGDMKTPEGVFYVKQVQDARSWTHDFKDGKGVIEGAYGTHFIRLVTPGHSGIGIHGTHAPESIGTRATEGCIRLNNKDLLKFVPYVYVNMPIVITSSYQDMMADKDLYEQK